MKISVIIPAYNEEKNISSVLSVLCKIPELYDILVMSDGSTDKTAEIARSFGSVVIELPENKGKSLAMREGLRYTDADVILFLDADLIGLSQQQVIDLVSPIIQDYADMTLGIFSSGRLSTDLAQKVAPFLTGQRAMKRWILDKLTEEDWMTGFGIEITLTKLAKNNHLRIIKVPLKNTTHVMKEEKMGVVRGVAARVKMYWEIAKEFNRL